jgi:hypothetical protein
MDAFTAQIVQMVREMPDEAILALVKNQLGAVVGAAGAGAAGAALPRARAGAPRAKRASKRRGAKRARAAQAAPAPKARKARAARPGRPAKKAKAAAPRRAGKAASKSGSTRASADRQNLVGTVERIVKSGGGMSASQVASAARAPQTRVANALKELKLAKRIFQGGDRRFARYAGDPRSAAQASENARKTASGPLTKKKSKR